MPYSGIGQVSRLGRGYVRRDWRFTATAYNRVRLGLGGVGVTETYFCVVRRNGRLSSELYYESPPRLSKSLPSRIVYVKRIDNQPHLAGRQRADLHTIWETLGKLPDISETDWVPPRPFLHPEEE